MKEELVRRLRERCSNKNVIVNMSAGVAGPLLCSLLAEAVDTSKIEAHFYLDTKEDASPYMTLARMLGIKLNIHSGETNIIAYNSENTVIFEAKDKTDLLLYGKETKNENPLEKMYKTQALSMAERYRIPMEINLGELQRDLKLPQRGWDSFIEYLTVDRILSLKYDYKYDKEKILNEGVNEKDYELVMDFIKNKRGSI